MMNQTDRASITDWIRNKLHSLADNEDFEQEKLAFIRRESVIRPTIFIGKSSCGEIAGANATLESVMSYLSENALKADVIEVGCIGLCSEEPIMDIQLPARPRLSFSKVTPSEVPQILSAVLNNELPSSNLLGQYRIPSKDPWKGAPFMDDHPFFRHQRRLLLKYCGITDPANIVDYIAFGGYKPFLKLLRNYTPDAVCEIIEKSGLRGRGGKGFPTGQKWRIAKDTPSDQKYLVCNADESDPGAYMNRSLIEGNPHLVIEGIAIAAYAIGATKAYIYIRKEYEKAVRLLENAIRQAREFGLLGNNIIRSGVNLEIVLFRNAGALVCGEETALISSIEGKRGMPSHKPPYPAQKGLFGRPTVVNNVETLANVPLIFEKGPSWYSSVGTLRSKGTKILALTGSLQRKGIIEVPMGTCLSFLIDDIAGGVPDGHSLKAIQIGGPLGHTFPASKAGISLDFESFETENMHIGSGSLVIMNEKTCMVSLAGFFIDSLKKESCGKCIPCREGIKRISEILDSVTRRPYRESGHDTLERFKGVMQLDNLTQVISDTALCGLGRSAPNSVVGTLRWFKDEYEEHIFDRTCKAGFCTELRTYVIDTEKCTGCSICAVKCPETAIIGTPRNPYFIVEGKCTGCGICYEVCKFSAIHVR